MRHSIAACGHCALYSKVEACQDDGRMESRARIRIGTRARNIIAEVRNRHALNVMLVSPSHKARTGAPEKETA